MNMAGGASQNIRFLILDKNGSQDSNFKKRAQTKPMPFCFGFLPDRPDDFSFNNFNRPYKPCIYSSIWSDCQVYFN